MRDPPHHCAAVVVAGGCVGEFDDGLRDCVRDKVLAVSWDSFPIPLLTRALRARTDLVGVSRPGRRRADEHE